MTMWIYLLINENAGNGNGLKTANEVMRLLDNKGISYETMRTLYPFHERVLVYDLLQKQKIVPWPRENEERPFPLLIVIGGDGTLHEVVNTIQNPNIPIAYIPANESDFGRTIGIRPRVKEALDQILNATQPIAVNTIYYHDLISDASGVCVANVGIGLDADIDNYTNHIRQRRRFGRRPMQMIGRLTTVLKDIFFKYGFPIRVEIKGQTLYFKHTFLCTLSNIPYLAGKIAIAPNADVYKKEFDLVVIEKQPWSRLLKIAFLLWRHRHFDSPDVHHYKADNIRLISTTPQRIQFDGQLWDKQPVDLTLTPGSQYIWLTKD